MIHENRNHQAVAWLWIIFSIALLLRFYGIDFGKPYNYHPDETKLVTQAGRLLASRFMDKDAYFAINVYPPFYTYMLAGAMGGYIGLGLLSGHFESLDAVRIAYDTEPFQFYLISRSLVAILGALSVLLVYKIASRLYTRRIGVFAALLLAVNFLHVRNSHFGTVDVPATFLGLVSIYFCARILQEGRLIHYIYAAIFAAFALATKFSMFTLAIPILFAHSGRYPARSWIKHLFDRKLWGAAGAGIGAFLIGCPLIWLDFRETWGGIVGTSRFERIGKIGSGGGFLSYWTGDQADGFGVFYPNSIPETFGVFLTLLAALAILYLMLKHRREDLFLLACAIPMYILFEKMSIKAMRHILPIIPLILLAMAILIVEITEKLKHRSTRTAALLIPVLFFSVAQFSVAISYQRALLHDDPRTTATTWIQQNLPPDSAVAIESFPPLLFLQKEHNFTLYETEWMSKTLNKRQEFMEFMNSNGSLYYVADDFTRQTFTWKFTQKKYPEIAKDRIDFFDWLERNSEKLVTFKSAHPKIQPTITIYYIARPDDNTTNRAELTGLYTL
ncbi:phospholipid carrier-dependent glycosyltransferase [candidate division KSB1 bacterium]|nr:glycosyltransferase family 39 protein [candidate division KSB1 bacterium]RQW06291.1 MAG: phospholipid carrier-dependent glycosyltransferase [candidate division KSB1 bacterium]